MSTAADMRERIAVTETYIEAHAADLKVVEGKVDVIEGKVESIEGAVGRFEAKFDTLIAKVDDLTAKIGPQPGALDSIAALVTDPARLAKVLSILATIGGFVAGSGAFLHDFVVVKVASVDLREDLKPEAPKVPDAPIAPPTAPIEAPSEDTNAVP